MIKVDYLNILYFAPIVFLVLTALGVGMLTKKKGEKWTYRFLLILSFVNFALHFLKQFFPSYIAMWPSGLARSTGENLCAVMVLASPFLLLSKNKYLYDYLFYMGVISSSLAYLFPTGALGLDLVDASNLFEVGRYYLCHAPILLVAVSLLTGRIHKLDYHRLLHLPFLILAAYCLILLDDVLLNLILYRQDWSTLLDRGQDIFNSSFLFGPGVWLDEAFAWAYNYLIPGLQTYRIDGVIHFTPILWLAPYLFILTFLFGPLFCIRSQHREMKMDIVRARVKWRLLQNKRKILKMEETK